MTEPRARNAAVRKAREIISGPYVVFDLETTGFSQYRHGIVSVAIIDHTGATLLNTLVNPEMPIENSRIHGITRKMVEDAPTFPQLHPVIVDLLQNKTALSYNFSFDSRFINGNCDRLQLRRPEGIKGECIMMLFAKFYSNYNPSLGGYRKQKLSAAAAHFKLDYEGGAHHAMADARMAWGVLRKMAEWEAAT